MDFSSYGSTVSLVAFLVTLIGFWIRSRSVKFAFFRRLGIPGPIPSVLDGNYKELTQSGTSPWLVVEDWIRKYGKVFGYFRTGPAPVLIISDHDMLKEILIKDFSHFADRTLISSPANRLPRIFRGSLVILTGQDWKRVRSTLTPTFTAKKMKYVSGIQPFLKILDWSIISWMLRDLRTNVYLQMSPTINRSVDVLLGILESKAETSETTDIYNLFQGLTLDVIGNCAFAANVDCQRNPKDVFLENVRGIFRSANNPFIRFIRTFPEFNFIISRLMKYVAPNHKRGTIITDNLEKLIRQRKEAKVADYVDMIQLMLDASDGRNVEQSPNAPGEDLQSFADVRTKYLTEDEIISNSFVFLLAGYETTANCLAFTTYLLAKYPQIQEKLSQEIRNNLGLILTPDYDRVQRLPYLEMVIAESLRLLPPVASFVTRVASETVSIKGQIIPAQTGVEVPVWHLQHDPEVWEKPYDFDPERFSAENKASIPAMAYMPFGAGPRNCIGMRFAQVEIKIALVRILQKYRLATCAESEVGVKNTKFRLRKMFCVRAITRVTYSFRFTKNSAQKPCI